MNTPGTGERPVAVVTGAARGIGAAVAQRLATDGFDLVLIDAGDSALNPGLSYRLSTRAELDAVVELVGRLGAVAVGVASDVRDPDAVAAAVAAVPSGRLRAAVAVAGVMGPDRPAWELSRAELEVDLDTNLHGVANLARAAVPQLLSADWGRFVAVVSTAGEVGLPRLAGYVASKHAALGYIRSLAADLGRSGVTANAVLPGSTDTTLLARSAAVYGLAGASAFAAHQRLGRLLQPDEIAAAVGWLCSRQASAVTGTALRVDGGFVG